MLIHFESEFTEGYHANSNDVGQDVILGGGFRGECVAAFAALCEYLGINWDIDDDYIYG